MLTLFDDVAADIEAARARLLEAARPKAPAKKAAKAAEKAKTVKFPRATPQPLAEAERREEARAVPHSQGCHWNGCTMRPAMWVVSDNFTAKFCSAHGATQIFRFRENGVKAVARDLHDTPTTTA